MNKTILVYATRWGATTETAKEIINVLKENHNIDVDLVNLKDKKNKNLDLSTYDNVILGVSFAKFRWAKEGKKFLKENRSSLEGKNIFVFISSGRCGDAHQKNDNEKYEKLQRKWIDDTLDKYNLEFTSRKAFGGVMPDKHNPVDNRDWDVIRNWAEELGRIINPSLE